MRYNAYAIKNKSTGAYYCGNCHDYHRYALVSYDLGTALMIKLYETKNRAISAFNFRGDKFDSSKQEVVKMEIEIGEAN